MFVCWQGSVIIWLDMDLFKPYPEIGYSSFRCALLSFKQQLILKVRARCGIYNVLL